MPPKKREESTIVQRMVRSNVGVVYWTSRHPDDIDIYTAVLAYGWSDGIITWTKERS